MTSANVSEYEAVKSALAVLPKAVDDQLVDELMGRAQAQRLKLTARAG